MDTKIIISTHAERNEKKKKVRLNADKNRFSESSSRDENVTN